MKKPFDLQRILSEQQYKKGIIAILGRWPGDETDEQIEEALRKLEDKESPPSIQKD